MVTQIQEDRHRRLYPWDYDYEEEVQRKKEEMLSYMEFGARSAAEFTHFLEVQGSQVHAIGRLGVERMCRRVKVIEKPPVLKESDKKKLTEGPSLNRRLGEGPYGFSQYFLNVLHLELGLSEKFQQRFREQLEGRRSGEIERSFFWPTNVVAAEGYQYARRRNGVRGLPSWRLVDENLRKAVKEYCSARPTE